MGIDHLAAGSMLGHIYRHPACFSFHRSGTWCKYCPKSIGHMLHIVLRRFLAADGAGVEPLTPTTSACWPVTLEVSRPCVRPPLKWFMHAIRHSSATFISPFLRQPRGFGAGLASLDAGRHIRYSLWWYVGLFVICFMCGWAWLVLALHLHEKRRQLTLAPFFSATAHLTRRQ